MLLVSVIEIGCPWTLNVYGPAYLKG
jgi:hypothetical protein